MNYEISSVVSTSIMNNNLRHRFTLTIVSSIAELAY